jgi:hypothetical protein
MGKKAICIDKNTLSADSIMYLDLNLPYLLCC